MRKTVITAAVSLLFSVAASAQSDTLRVSARYTSHVIFSTDITYADKSDGGSIAAKVVEQNKNMIALKARGPFTEPCSVSALESNGRMWTFIVVYDDSPENLIVDTRRKETEVSSDSGKQAEEKPKTSVKKGRRKSSEKERTASTWKSGDAPTLDEVSKMGRELYHIGTAGYGVNILCENIYSYSDITYMVFSVDNTSGISYDVTDATFVIESRKRSKRTVAYDQTIFPRSRYGSLAAGPGRKGKIVYSFDKMTLSKEQVLKVYLYENGGQRNLVMTVSPSDINRAKSLAGK
jgi:hypothetical protein